MKFTGKNLVKYCFFLTIRIIFLFKKTRAYFFKGIFLLRKFLINSAPLHYKAKIYRNMQKKRYRAYTITAEQSKKLCVGHFETHQKYPYINFLLEHATGKKNNALDFGCGPARMMLQMLSHFEKVDGMDIDSRNLIYADSYLVANDINRNRFNLYLGDGLGVKPLPPITYDFIYSTICLQHISVYKIRRQMFVDILNLLTVGGTVCIQVGYGWQGPAGWFENRYDALITNGGFDASIPDLLTLDKVEEDLLEIGFSKVQMKIKPSPHPELNNEYHPFWLFIHLENKRVLN
jgi:hypothetical protein